MDAAASRLEVAFNRSKETFMEEAEAIFRTSPTLNSPAGLGCDSSVSMERSTELSLHGCGLSAACSHNWKYY